MDWITDHIAIGNFLDARNVSSRDVEAVLCLKENCCDEDHESLDVVCIPLVDGAGNDLRLCDDAVTFIDEVVTHGERILVHCHAGRSRSVCIVARYLMMKKGFSRQGALELIGSKRDVYLSPGIEDIIHDIPR